MSNLETDILKVLDSSTGERAIHAFLKKHPLLVRNAFSQAWNANICVPEFPLGNDWRADFLLLSANSGMWYATLIELESPKSKLYLKDGTPSKILRVAQRQINDWKDWVRINETYLRQRFSIILRGAETPAQCSAGKHKSGETEILDPNTVIAFRFHIVIGRRSSLSPDEQKRRARESEFWGGPEVATYDRLVDMARRFDKAEWERSEMRSVTT